MPRDRVDREVFNVGTEGMNYTIAEVGEIVADEVPGTDVQHVDAVEDARNYRVAFGKIREALGFEPAYDLRSGIREMAEAIEADPALRTYGDPIFSNLQVMRQRFETSGLPVRA